MVKKILTRVIPPLSSLAIFSLSLWTIGQTLHQYQAEDIWSSLLAISRLNILTAIALMTINYMIMTGYDILGVAYVGHLLSYPKMALVGIICSGISNNVGLAILSSSMIRYRFYSAWGLPTLSIAKIAAFCNFTFCLGMFVVGGILFLKEPLAIPNLIDLPFASVRPLGYLFLLIILGYLLVTVIGPPLKLGKLVLPQLPLKIALGQLLVSSLDWCLAAGVFYVLLQDSITISYTAFFGIYLLAQVAGLVSNIPGGLGVFETVMLLLLASSISSEKLLGTFLIYRGIYYFIPLTVAVILLGKYELGCLIDNTKSSFT
ncbi:MAG TPA: hypothetical protein DCF68_12525 [Cyanothece sp. UBA12306]|nr:hypothetical protein [Cyanothece sp. UBA12306]